MDSLCQPLAKRCAKKLDGKLSAEIYGPMAGPEEPPLRRGFIYPAEVAGAWVSVNLMLDLPFGARFR